MIKNRLSLLVLASITATGSACSTYVDTDGVQCNVDSDCAALGADYANYVCNNSLCQAPMDPWACLDGPAAPPVSGNVHVNMTMVDLLSRKPVSGLTLTLCAKLDSTCLFPISYFKSNEAGQIDAEVPAGFDGYFQAEGAGMYPTLIFPPSTRTQRSSRTLPVVPASFFGSMYTGIGVTVASDRSAIMTTVLDCEGRPAEGISLSSPQADAQTVTYMLAGGLMSRTSSSTDDSGAGGLVNIPPGGALITSTLAATNRVTGTVGVQTRAGFLTMVLAMPNGS